MSTKKVQDCKTLTTKVRKASSLMSGGGGDDVAGDNKTSLSLSNHCCQQISMSGFSHPLDVSLSRQQSSCVWESSDRQDLGEFPFFLVFVCVFFFLFFFALYHIFISLLFFSMLNFSFFIFSICSFLRINSAARIKD